MLCVVRVVVFFVCVCFGVVCCLFVACWLRVSFVLLLFLFVCALVLFVVGLSCLLLFVAVCV